MKKQHLAYECAENGLEALNAYKYAPEKYAIILMDMNMPVMDGFEATAKIRDFERRNKIDKTIIVAITGLSNSDARAKANDAGVDDFLTKPIRMKELTALVAGLLQM